jgi:PAS domain S-box-containing protein
MTLSGNANADVEALRRELGAETEARRRLERELLDMAAALHLSREQFHVLAQKGPVGILQADAEGRCTYANEKWCELTGLAPEETLGYQWSHAVHPDDVAMVMEKWAESVARRQPYVNELRLVHRAGRIIDVITAAMPILDAQGLTVGFIGTVMDITERNDSLRSLADREQVLRRLIEVQENEKRSLCHEFHDGLIQHAVGAKMLLESWLHEHPAAPDALVITEAVRSLTVGIIDGRRTIRGIRPAVLDDLGLEAALDDLADQVATADMVVDLHVEPGLGSLPSSLQTTIYRVVQESLNNARRHSGSDRVVVHVTRCDGAICVTAEDFGTGFDVDAGRQRGCGLIGMLERVRLAGGECRITSIPGRGTRVEARLRID